MITKGFPKLSHQAYPGIDKYLRLKCRQIGDSKKRRWWSLHGQNLWDGVLRWNYTLCNKLASYSLSVLEYLQFLLLQSCCKGPQRYFDKNFTFKVDRGRAIYIFLALKTAWLGLSDHVRMRTEMHHLATSWDKVLLNLWLNFTIITPSRKEASIGILITVMMWAMMMWVILKTMCS